MDEWLNKQAAAETAACAARSIAIRDFVSAHSLINQLLFVVSGNTGNG